MSKKYRFVSIVFVCLSAYTLADDAGVTPLVAPKQEGKNSEKSTQQVASQSATKPAPVDQSLLDDLARIRKQMGGSVLSGSMLAGGAKDSEAAFQDGVQTLIQNSDTQPDPNPLQFDQPAAPTFTQLRCVRMLREQGVKLDRVANALEKLKQYRHADDLRESAKELRELARAMDVVPPTDPSVIPSQ